MGSSLILSLGSLDLWGVRWICPGFVGSMGCVRWIIVSLFSGRITCGNCGKKYRRKVTGTGAVWICSTYNHKGKSACASRQIPEAALEKLTVDLDLNDITGITANNGNQLVFRFRDGHECTRQWEDRSRSESWTPEMKERARIRTKQNQEAN